MVSNPIEDARALARAAERAQGRADAARHARDEAIRAALAAGNAQATLATVTGLSPTAVRKIAGQGGDQ